MPPPTDTMASPNNATAPVVSVDKGPNDRLVLTFPSCQRSFPSFNVDGVISDPGSRHLIPETPVFRPVVCAAHYLDRMLISRRGDERCDGTEVASVDEIDVSEICDGTEVD